MLALQATACFSRQVLPARTQPSRDRPSIAIEPGPPPPGTGRVVLDSTDGPTEVQEVVAYASGEAYGARGFGFASATSTKPICETPCVADLPYGNHHLLFGRDDANARYEATVVAGAKPSVYRVAPSVTTGPSARGLAVVIDVLALSALIFGPVVMANASKAPSDVRENYQAAAVAVTVAGVVALGVGLVVDFAGRGTIQPGSGVQWVPADGATYKSVP